MKMFSIGGLAALLVLSLGFAAYESQQVEGVITLETQLVGKIASGDVLYVDYDKNKRAFFANVQDAEPNVDLSITFRRGSTFQKISTMQADGKGRARLRMYSAIPQLKPNDLIEVWRKKDNVCIASGNLGVFGIEGN